LFGGLDESILPGLIDGEKRNVNAYLKALDRPDLNPDVRNLLEQQRLRIDAAITRMEGLKD
jgi:limonene-1,2-epoxide hydrolase